MADLMLKCTKLNFRWGSRDPQGELTTPLDPVAVFKGPTSRRREGMGNGKGMRGRVAPSFHTLTTEHKLTSGYYTRWAEKGSLLIFLQ